MDSLALSRKTVPTCREGMRGATSCDAVPELVCKQANREAIRERRLTLVELSRQQPDEESEQSRSAGKAVTNDQRIVVCCFADLRPMPGKPLLKPHILQNTPSA